MVRIGILFFFWITEYLSSLLFGVVVSIGLPPKAFLVLRHIILYIVFMKTEYNVTILEGRQLRGN